MHFGKSYLQESNTFEMSNNKQEQVNDLKFVFSQNGEKKKTLTTEPFLPLIDEMPIRKNSQKTSIVLKI